MGILCASTQEEIERFVSILNISIDPEVLQRAAEQLCRGEVLDDLTSQSVSRVREGIEGELDNLTYCKELTRCFVDAMAVLRRVTSGEFVWKVFCSSDQRKCKRPRSDYSKAFQSIRRYFKGIWAWNLERVGYSLPDSIRTLSLYDLFRKDAECFTNAHIAAAKVYKQLVSQRAEYMEPDFASFIVEYAFHTASATKPTYRLFPLQSLVEGKTKKSIRDEFRKKMEDLRKEKSLKEFLEYPELMDELIEKCIHRLESDEEAVRAIGVSDYKNACELILGV